MIIYIKVGGVDGFWINVFDVYKMKGICVVEYWDCLQVMDNKIVFFYFYFQFYIKIYQEIYSMF